MGKASRRKSGKAPKKLMAEAMSAIQAASGGKDVVVVSNAPETEKMSYALVRLLKEEVPDAVSLEEYRAELSVIVIAWNLSLLSAEKRSEALKDFITRHQEEDSATIRDALGHLERLMARKQALFPADRRQVVSFNVRLEGDEVRILAAGIVKPEEA